MLHRFPTSVLVGASVTLTAAAFIVMAWPLAGAATASACKRFGNDLPQSLSRHQARTTVVCLLNHSRHRHGLGPLHTSHRLKNAAQSHSRRMVTRHCFDHVCPGEASVLARLQHVNYIVSGLKRWLYGENIGYGAGDWGSPRKMVRAWMHSPEHRHNILKPGFRQIGVGVVRGIPPKHTTNAFTYTTDFGLRRG